MASVEDGTRSPHREAHPKMLSSQGCRYCIPTAPWVFGCLRASICWGCIPLNGEHLGLHPHFSCHGKNKGGSHQENDNTPPGAFWSSPSCSIASTLSSSFGLCFRGRVCLDGQHDCPQVDSWQPTLLQNLCCQQSHEHYRPLTTQSLESCRGIRQSGRLRFTWFISSRAFSSSLVVERTKLASAGHSLLAQVNDSPSKRPFRRSPRNLLACHYRVIVFPHLPGSLLELFTIETCYCLGLSLH